MPDLEKLFAVNVPRYTSYPTAPHFHPGVNEEAYRRWLSELPVGMPLSLYVHVPFCDTLCWFCACNMSVVNHYQPVADYLELLLGEVALLANALSGHHPVLHVHWGGGSPTLLKDTDIVRLSDRLRRHFDLDGNAEFAIEIDPRGLRPATVKALARAGLSRASIGLQDCDAKVQHAINRVQTDAETREAIAMLRVEGVAGVNLDLVYGLPHQTLRSWRATLDFALGLDPDRLAVFGYAHVPQFKKHQSLIAEKTLPGTLARLEMAQLAQEVISAHGYAAIGLDHFAKPGDSLARAARSGTLSRNFQGYTADHGTALLGLGASSIGSLPGGYVQNISPVPLYRPLIGKGRLPIARGIGLSDGDRIRRKAIEELMCRLEVDLDKLAQGVGPAAALFEAPLDRLSPLIERGLVERKGMLIKVPRRWIAALRLAASAFDEYLPRHKAVHSLSV